MIHPMKCMLEKRSMGVKCAMPSYCSANELVIEAIMEQAKRQDDTILIEATANQVNQFGGYTGMKPDDFVRYIDSIADKTGFRKENILLGGDHLGPLTWCEEKEEDAMCKSIDLVKSFVKAGFTKIHLDTSMKLKDDSPLLPLETKTIAKRGVILYQACEEAYRELRKENPDAVRPVYVIGSEVPIPGGSREKEDNVAVTSAQDFEDMLKTYGEIFEENGIKDAWDSIIAVVVQPGVEFSDSTVCMYDRVKANELCTALKKHPSLVFEGHSTDYQSARLLKEMVEDGVGILKVGPALTFSLREALFALHEIEREILPPGRQHSDFTGILEQVMLEKTENWKNHYHGNAQQLLLARKYSFSDRTRYYLGEQRIKNAMEEMFFNLNEAEIPLNMLCQYMPVQYKRVRDGLVKNEARALAKDAVVQIVYDYDYAAKENYQVEYR